MLRQRLMEREEKPLMGNPQGTNNRLLFLLTAFACIGGALFGYDTGVVSGAMLLIASKRAECPRYGGFGLSHMEQEIIVSSTVLAAILGSVLSGFFGDRFGRRPMILTGSVLFTAGSVLLAIAHTVEELVGGRVVVGLAIGFASHTTPMYLGEVAPPHVRGRIVAAFNIFIVAGQVLASVMDGVFFYLDDGWRYMLGCAAVLSVIQFFGFLFLPESPRWMYKTGKRDKAIHTLQKIRGSNHIEAELNEIEAALTIENETMSWFEILRSGSLRRQLGLGCGLMLLQQLVGINTVMYYSATILKDAGFGGSKGKLCCCSSDAIPIWLSAGTAAAQMTGCIAGMYLVDKVGRRKPVLFSLVGVVVFLTILGFSFQIDLGSATNAMSMIGLVGYLLVFGVGMGPIPWILNSEIYPMKARSRCNSAAVGTNWTSNFIISVTFLSLTDWIGTGPTFWLFAAIALLGAVWMYWALPETQNKSLQEIQDLFEHRPGRLVEEAEAH